MDENAGSRARKGESLAAAFSQSHPAPNYRQSLEGQRTASGKLVSAASNGGFFGSAALQDSDHFLCPKLAVAFIPNDRWSFFVTKRTKAYARLLSSPEQPTGTHEQQQGSNSGLGNR